MPGGSDVMPQLCCIVPDNLVTTTFLTASGYAKNLYGIFSADYFMVIAR